MSDSYVLDRAGTQVKRRKPPKKPTKDPAPWPMWVSGFFAAHFAVAYGLSASAQHIASGLWAGLSLLVHARDLYRWWQWRRWVKWTGEKHVIIVSDRELAAVFVFRWFMTAGAAFVASMDVVRFVLDGKLPGQ
jgi:hypothetical protein